MFSILYHKHCTNVANVFLYKEQKQSEKLRQFYDIKKKKNFILV